MRGVRSAPRNDKEVAAVRAVEGGSVDPWVEAWQRAGAGTPEELAAALPIFERLGEVVPGAISLEELSSTIADERGPVWRAIFDRFPDEGPMIFSKIGGSRDQKVP